MSVMLLCIRKIVFDNMYDEWFSEYYVYKKI